VTLRVFASGVTLACCLHAAPLWAQRAALGRYELSAGPTWIGAATLRSQDATLTGSDGARYRLFSTSSELAATTGISVRFGGRLAGVVDAELSGSYGRPLLTTTVTADAENAATLAISDAVHQFAVEGGALVRLWQRSTRVQPFATAGGGYLRQLHEGNTLAETGRLVYAGGGIKIPLVSRSAGARFTQLGVRVDVRAVIRSGGIGLDDGQHVAPALSASLFARF
jgi:hypothetical protein